MKTLKISAQLACAKGQWKKIGFEDLLNAFLLSVSFLLRAGELQIGRITFEISLNISYTDLEPHITELSDHIAHELNVSHAQVSHMTHRGLKMLLQYLMIIMVITNRLYYKFSPFLCLFDP